MWGLTPRVYHPQKWLTNFCTFPKTFEPFLVYIKAGLVWRIYKVVALKDLQTKFCSFFGLPWRIHNFFCIAKIPQNRRCSIFRTSEIGHFRNPSSDSNSLSLTFLISLLSICATCDRWVMDCGSCTDHSTLLSNILYLFYPFIVFANIFRSSIYFVHNVPVLIASKVHILRM